MQYISSDTNIWVDFELIHCLDLPFVLNYTYCMSRDAIQEELLSPPDISSRLIDMGLVPLEITELEFQLALTFGTKYCKLSVYDRIALAIAKSRNYILLSGDGALRKAANKEHVTVHGTLWIFDRLLEERKISLDDYHTAMISLKNDTTGKIRLPPEELNKRLNLQAIATNKTAL